MTMRSGTLDGSLFDLLLAVFVSPWQSPAGEEEMQHGHVCDAALGRFPGALQRQRRGPLPAHQRGLQHLRKEGQRAPEPRTALGSGDGC